MWGSAGTKLKPPLLSAFPSVLKPKPRTKSKPPVLPSLALTQFPFHLQCPQAPDPLLQTQPFLFQLPEQLLVQPEPQPELRQLQYQPEPDSQPPEPLSQPKPQPQLQQPQQLGERRVLSQQQACPSLSPFHPDPVGSRAPRPHPAPASVPTPLTQAGLVLPAHPLPLQGEGEGAAR